MGPSLQQDEQILFAQMDIKSLNIQIKTMLRERVRRSYPQAQIWCFHHFLLNIQLKAQGYISADATKTGEYEEIAQ